MQRPCPDLIFEELDHLLALFDLFFEQLQKILCFGLRHSKIERIHVEGTPITSAGGSLQRLSQWGAGPEHTLGIDNLGGPRDRSGVIDR